ncbi:hypothetical protein TrVGV298_009363 [Trichoderma virens]|nr:hypothetical protein TrVGV298_009363 [Trichoderma virens]
MDQSEERPYALSVVRLSFHPDHRDKIDTSEQWYKVMDTIKHQLNFGYVCKGESIDDELDVVLIIAWENGARPPAAFLSGNLDCIFEPLSRFVAKKPQIMVTLYRRMRGHNIREFTTRGAGMQFMAEIMTIRGPVHVIEPALREIESDIRSYLDTQMIAFDFYDITDSSLMHGSLFHVGDDCKEHSGEDEVSFVFHLEWRGQEQRKEFHDADIPDRALPPHLQEHFPSNFWQETVVERLEKVGATASSWTYHKGEIARDEKDKEVIASEFAHWYHYGHWY